MNHLSTSAHPFVGQRSAALWNWEHWNQFKFKLMLDSFVHFGKPDYLTFLQIFSYCSAAHRRLWALADKHSRFFSLLREFVLKREKEKWNRQLPASIIHLLTTQPRCCLWGRMAARWQQFVILNCGRLQQIFSRHPVTGVVNHPSDRLSSLSVCVEGGKHRGIFNLFRILTEVALTARHWAEFLICLGEQLQTFRVCGCAEELVH